MSVYRQKLITEGSRVATIAAIRAQAFQDFIPARSPAELVERGVLPAADVSVLDIHRARMGAVAIDKAVQKIVAR